MHITIDFRHPWSDMDKVARIQREDLTGKQARRVIQAAKAQLSRGVYSSLYVDYPRWCSRYSGNLDDWDKACKERFRLEELCRRYEWRTYTTKELDELTAAEWAEIAPWYLDMLNEFQRKRYNV